MPRHRHTKDGSLISEQRYIVLRGKLAQAVGLRLSNKIIKLIKYFYSAPALQITAYIVTLLREDGLKESNHQIISELVLLKAVEGSETCHRLAKEISKKHNVLSNYTWENGAHNNSGVG